MTKRIYNFNPGPSTLPLPVLEEMQVELLDYKGTGMSILETSHRSPEFAEILAETKALIRELAGLSEDYHILFMGGGASMQFATIPLNFLKDGKSADYVNTGVWSKKAIKEAKIIGNVNVAASSDDKNFTYLPQSLNLSPDACYVHMTSNNTIFGTQWHRFPDTGNVPLICDMSSDIFSRTLPFDMFQMIYAGAQKNLGPAGVTLVIMHKDLAARAKEGLNAMLSYATYIEKDSLFNTPPAYGIYMVMLVLRWIKKQGGLTAVEKVNDQKQKTLYGAIDNSGGYFKGTTEVESRSWMNVTMRMRDEDLEKKFIAEAKAAGLVGLKGHRSVGGIRASMYNAMTLAGIERLVAFMDEFKKSNP
ncbi:MAG: 3-phosphoserine/phosphohydroxythreonine transaminase [Candidatus Zixiibacteriota bacterium]